MLRNDRIEDAVETTIRSHPIHLGRSATEASIRTVWKTPVVTIQALAEAVPDGLLCEFAAILDTETGIAFGLRGEKYKVEEVAGDATVYYAGVVNNGYAFCIECAGRNSVVPQVWARRFRTTTRVPRGKHATTCRCGRRITIAYRGPGPDVHWRVHHGPVCGCAHLEVFHEPGGRCLGTGRDLAPEYGIDPNEECACEGFEYQDDQ